MPSSYPPQSQKYVTADQLEWMLKHLSNQVQTNVKDAPLIPRLEATPGGETLFLGEWKFYADVNGQLIISSNRTGKTAITITDNYITVGNPMKEHIVLEL